MKVNETALPGVLLIEPRVYGDERGFFYESYNERDFQSQAGVRPCFVQDNHSRSARNVLRGLHYQIQKAQGKLVRVIVGEVYDVVVDLRRSSAHFGKWMGDTLSGENKKILWVPPGFAHGFFVMSEYAEFLYKTTDYWVPEFERCIIWNDPDLAIDWPLKTEPIVSEKDRRGVRLREAEVFP